LSPRVQRRGVGGQGSVDRASTHDHEGRRGSMGPPMMHRSRSAIAIALALGFGASMAACGSGHVKAVALPPGVVVQHLRPQAVGFYGEMFSPRDTSARRPAVVAFGGSEGGIGIARVAARLAGTGTPALALAYFKEPGLPKN